MEILEFQINATRGATRALSGDFKSMADSLEAAVSGNDPIARLIVSLLRAKAAQDELTNAQKGGTSGGTEWGQAEQGAAAAAVEMSAAAREAVVALGEEAQKKQELG